jgi:hypothetical protein
MVLALALGVAAAGCGEDASEDAGLGEDAGALDAGGPADAGAEDAGGEPDAGEGSDAGSPADAGGEDASTPTDAGPGTDAGAAAGDTCATAVDLTDGGTMTGSTSGATDDYGPSAGGGCPVGGAASGPDRAYVLSPAVSRDYVVTVTPTGSFDPMLYATTDCTFSAGRGCLAGTVLNGAGEAEQISFTVDGGATAYVIVDGELLSSGDYEIEVTFTE